MRESEVTSETITKLMKAIKNNRLDLHPIYQRPSEQWNVEQQSLFIHSIFYTYPIPPIYLYTIEKDEDEILFDGLQRISTIKKFLDNDLRLTKDIPPYHYKKRFAAGIFEGDLILAGKTYKELVDDTSEGLIESIFNDRTLPVIRIYECNEDERNEVFYRLNNGTAMSNAQKAMVTVGSKNTEILHKISKLPLFIKYSGLTAAQKKHSEVSNIVSIVAMLLCDYPCKKFDSSKIRAFTKEVKNDKHNINYSDLEILFTEISNAIPMQYDRIKVLKKYQIIILAYCVVKLKSNNLDTDDFVRWMIEYIARRPENCDYLNTKNMTSRTEIEKKTAYILNKYSERKGVTDNE